MTNSTNQELYIVQKETSQRKVKKELFPRLFRISKTPTISTIFLK